MGRVVPRRVSTWSFARGCWAVLLAASGASALSAARKPQLSGVEIAVAVQPQGDLGLGAFTLEAVTSGAYVCTYQGETIDYDELARRYPSLEPEYCFRVSGEDETEVYVDAFASDHWSRRMNHDAVDPTVDFAIADRRCVFYAKRDIRAGEALCFDYGSEFWDGRSDAPAEGTDQRIFAAAFQVLEAQGSLYLGAPLSSAALNDLLRSDAAAPLKNAAIMRALDYFAVDRDRIELAPPRRLSPRRVIRFLRREKNGPRFVTYEGATTRQLARALRHILRRVEEEDDLDDDDDDDDGGLKLDDDSDEF